MICCAESRGAAQFSHAPLDIAALVGNWTNDHPLSRVRDPRAWVLLFLMQSGGLGLMTFGVFVIYLTNGTNSTGSTYAPRWLRLTRRGNVFTAFASTDGATWTQVGSETIAMGTATYLGLAVTSHNNAALATDTFDNLGATTP